MTTFKEKLDKEFGEAPRFTQSLQQDILQQVQQTRKEPRRWQYPLIIIGTIVTLLLLIEMGPLGHVDHVKHASIVQLAQQEEIKKYTMAQNWEEDSFKAGRPGWVIGQQVFEQSSDKVQLKKILQQATVTLKNDRKFFRVMRDIWVEFDNGQVVKLKMSLNDEHVIISDYNNNLFYIVENEDMASAYLALAERNDVDIEIMDLIVFIVIFISIEKLVEKLVRKKFNIPKEYVNKGHQHAIWIVKILNIIMLMVIMFNEWIVYMVIVGGYLAVILFSSILIDYYYGREEKRHYLSICSALVGLLLLSLFIVFVS
ncbi:DUF4181 domain-containing protein [Lysinibacillus cavernae]|uniref:DUF4181 domain-containing protein n=1 Tax=Lysinibacillus cavernae TaxID=2666135 RepID=UPI0012D9A616|nr:DUF4181 domain-containing protein [Lysinibacillus cavernae]